MAITRNAAERAEIDAVVRWVGYSELKAQVESDTARLERLRRLLPLSKFMTICLLPNGFEYPEVCAEAIQLTGVGAELEAWVLRDHPELGRANVRAALLGRVAYHDPLIDFDNTDYAVLRDVWSSEVQSRRVRYPFIYHRELYDRFFELFGNEVEGLTVEDTQALLDGTTQGVYQVGSLVTGNGGLADASRTRYLPPVEK